MVARAHADRGVVRIIPVRDMPAVRGIEAFVEIKQRDPRFGHQRIAARVEYNQPSHFGANDMSKERNSSRETKKPPATTQKEKKAAKKAKKDAKKQLRD